MTKKLLASTLGLVTAGFAAVCIAPSGMDAQNPTAAHPYPANDRPLRLPSGTVVRQRNLVVFRGRNGTALTITIETPTAAVDSARVNQEAHEVAVLHDTYAQIEGINRITVAICRTQACLELREAAIEMFHFWRRQDGTWRADHAPASSRGLSNDR